MKYECPCLTGRNVCFPCNLSTTLRGFYRAGLCHILREDLLTEAVTGSLDARKRVNQFRVFRNFIVDRKVLGQFIRVMYADGVGQLVSLIYKEVIDVLAVLIRNRLGRCGINVCIRCIGNRISLIDQHLYKVICACNAVADIYLCIKGNSFGCARIKAKLPDDHTICFVVCAAIRCLYKIKIGIQSILQDIHLLLCCIVAELDLIGQRICILAKDEHLIHIHRSICFIRCGSNRLNRICRSPVLYFIGVPLNRIVLAVRNRSFCCRINRYVMRNHNVCLIDPVCILIQCLEGKDELSGFASLDISYPCDLPSINRNGIGRIILDICNILNRIISLGDRALKCLYKVCMLRNRISQSIGLVACGRIIQSNDVLVGISHLQELLVNILTIQCLYFLDRIGRNTVYNNIRRIFRIVRITCIARSQRERSVGRLVRIRIVIRCVVCSKCCLVYNGNALADYLDTEGINLHFTRVKLFCPGHIRHRGIACNEALMIIYL